jgi:hypothetical protein
MRPVQVLSLYVETALLLVLCAGLLRRRRAALCWSFLAYALAVVGGNQLQRVMHAKYWGSDYHAFFSYYVLKETVLFVVKALVALEIWLRTFAVFPRARLRVGLLLVSALLVLVAVVQIVPSERDQWDLFIGVVVPRLQVGALALYLIVALAARSYFVPVHEFHRAVFVGFGAYLTLHTLTFAYHGWSGMTSESFRIGFTLEAIAYPATVTWWAWAAWRPLREPSPILSRLQPWAPSS